MEKELKEYPKKELIGAVKLFDFSTDEIVVQGFYNKKDGRGNYPFMVLFENKTVEPHTFVLSRANNPCNIETAYNCDIPNYIKLAMQPFRYG